MPTINQKGSHFECCCRCIHDPRSLFRLSHSKNQYNPSSLLLADWRLAWDPSIPTTTMSRIDFQWKAAQQWLRLLVFLLTVFDKFLWSLNASNWIVLITTTSGISLPKLIVLCLGEYNNYKINDQICSHLHPPSCNTTNKNYATLHVWRLHTIWFHSNISPSSIYLCLSILK